MAQATFHFPRGFLWGTATAAHQVEGNNTNNSWWDWEQRSGKIRQGDKSGMACDWWRGRWREDFDRAADGGQNAHRLSIEWGRIQPAPDRWDEAALDRYREMLRGLNERGLTPFVTLHHFTDPLWFYEAGSWEQENAPELFVRFVQKSVEALKEYASYWITINEPNLVAANGYLLGNFPPGKKDLRLTMRVMTNLARAHAAAYQSIHKLQPTARVGIGIHYAEMIPARSWSPLDRIQAGLINSALNDFLPSLLTSGKARVSAWRVAVPEAKNTLDYFGLNYYARELAAFTLDLGKYYSERHFPPGAEASDSGMFANDPEGMASALQWARGYKLPIVISENGIEDAEDRLRPRFIVENLHQVWRAVNEGTPVKAYLHWTLVDNFEWERGWSQRFGLWELDTNTQARRKRPSADLYAEICRENGISSEMVERYAPELLPKLFPD